MTYLAEDRPLPLAEFPILSVDPLNPSHPSLLRALASVASRTLGSPPNATYETACPAHCTSSSFVRPPLADIHVADSLYGAAPSAAPVKRS